MNSIQSALSNRHRTSQPGRTVTNLVAMDPTTLVPLALAFGLLVGGGRRHRRGVGRKAGAGSRRGDQHRGSGRCRPGARHPRIRRGRAGSIEHRREGVAGRPRVRAGLESRPRAPRTHRHGRQGAPLRGSDHGGGSPRPRAHRRGEHLPLGARRAARRALHPPDRRGPHRGLSARGGAPRLRRQHQPRAQDPDRSREPARGSARQRVGRAGTGQEVREAAPPKSPSGSPRSRRRSSSCPGCRPRTP